ncbi:MAG: hypothetical protein Q8R08_01950, partial [bacterium]|nr:hypothetical protein [bacterium]
MGKLLKWLVFSSLYKSATEDDRGALDENTSKHVRALIKSLVVIPGTILTVKFGGQAARDIVLYVSIAAQIVGIAWFVLTFAALPKRHINAAMRCTEHMFSAFLGGVIALTVFAGFTAPLSLLVIMPIYVWMYSSAAIYDSADRLKAGLDEQKLKAAEATPDILAVLKQIL